jgi:hypothetical protein
MSNREVHQLAGAIVGAAYAALQARGERSDYKTAEIIGGFVAGKFAGCLPDKIDPPASPRHRSVGHGVIPCGVAGIGIHTKMAEWQQSLRTKANEYATKRAGTEDPLLHLFYGLIEYLYRFAAGAASGFVAGYGSHLFLDARTRSGLPLIA